MYIGSGTIISSPGLNTQYKTPVSAAVAPENIVKFSGKNGFFLLEFLNLQALEEKQVRLQRVNNGFGVDEPAARAYWLFREGSEIRTSEAKHNNILALLKLLLCFIMNAPDINRLYF